jgi:O-antigen/teichoic acid export membrane protein
MTLAMPGQQRHALASNAVSTVMARLLVPVFNVLLVISIARLAGAAGLGQYTLLITLFQLCEQLKSLGLTTFVVREVSRDHEAAAACWSSLTRIGYWGALCASPVMLAVALAKNPLSWSVGLASAATCLGFLPSSQVLANDAVFLALGRASYSLWIAMAENIFRFAASIGCLVFWHSGMLQLVAIYGCARFVAAIAGGIARRNLLGPALAPYDSSQTRAMLRKAPSFLAIFVAPLIFYRMDVLLLGVMATDYQVGVYSAAVRLISVAMIIPDGIMTAMFALLSRVSGYQDRTKYHRLIQGALELLGAAVATVVVCGFIGGPFVVHLLFGSKFDASTPVFQILVWGLIPILVYRVLGDSLVADGEQKAVARMVVVGMIVSAVLYVVLIKLLGMPGAAWGFLLSTTGLCVWVALESVFRFRIAAIAPVMLSLTPAVAGPLAVLAPKGSFWVIGALAAAQVAAIVAFIRGRTWLKPQLEPSSGGAATELAEVSSL